MSFRPAKPEMTQNPKNSDIEPRGDHAPVGIMWRIISLLRNWITYVHRPSLDAWLGQVQPQNAHGVTAVIRSGRKSNQVKISSHPLLRIR